MNPFKTIKHHLYLFQLENYGIGRYWRVVRSRLIPRELPRQELVWTSKALSLLAVAVFLQVVFASLIATNFLVFIIVVYLFSFVHFIFLIGAMIMVRPLDYLLKQRIIKKAKRKIAKFPKLKIIGITGSYGKTTMKEALAAVLGQKFKVLKTPTSVNTPLGISRLILKALDQQTEVLIVEMGAYQRGDIKALCQIRKPDIAVLTGLNEAHLERFGSIENTIRTKFELLDTMAANGLALLNKDNELVMRNYPQHRLSQEIKFFRSQASEISAIKFHQDGSGTSFIIEGIGRIKMPFLGEYILGIAHACVIMAKHFGLSSQEIKQGLRMIRPVPHRLQVVRTSGDILIIDDSYNGNPEGVRAAIKTLAKFTGRRKIYITPGLVEVGSQSQQVHKQIGRALSEVADLVVLVRNSVTGFIARELPSDRVIWLNSAREARDKLSQILKSGDAVLFQNDWPDNYL